MSDEKLAVEIVANSVYLTTATCTENLPWIAPTMFWMDDAQHFYIVSAAGSRHVQHLQVNPHAAVSIYDSTQSEGTGRGLQFGASAVILSTPDAMATAAAWLEQRLPSATGDENFGSKTADRWQANGRVVV